jgi:YD repeat-containing protein
VLVERRRINASNLRSVGYDPASRMLEIEFTGGNIVRYAGVPTEIHRRLMNAPSPSFFWDSIEEDFPATRVR